MKIGLRKVALLFNHICTVGETITSLRFDDGRHLGRQAEVKLLPQLLPTAVVVRFPAEETLSVM